jgi:hypothetical protein
VLAGWLGGVCLETVHLELLLLGNAYSREILAHIVSLIALQLNDLTILWMLYDCTITRELLLESTDDLLLVKFVSDTLDSGQCLATISLLNSYVNKTAAQINVCDVL